MHHLDRRHFMGGVTGALGLMGATATPKAAPSSAQVPDSAPGGRDVRVLAAFDGGMLPPFTIEDGVLTFDCRTGRILNVLVRRAPARLRVRVLMSDNEARFVATQGLIASVDGESWFAAPLAKTAAGSWEATVESPGGDLRLASRYPYGRDSLDRLLCDTSQVPNTRWRYLRQGQRGMPVFELGQDDGRKPIHFLIGGEDAWETAGQWVADAMVRAVCANRALADKLSARSLVRIVPLASPFSATQPGESYTDPEGRSLYGAAKWADAEPPPEFALLRREVEEATRRKRLGFMMTLHSWQASQPTTTIETIQSAGDNVLSPARMEWARRVLDAMIAGVPRGQAELPQKIWHPGLARDYLLARHNAITFRVEITTRGQGHDAFRQTGQRFIENLSALTDWRPVCNS